MNFAPHIHCIHHGLYRLALFYSIGVGYWLFWSRGALQIPLWMDIHELIAVNKFFVNSPGS